MTYKWSLIKTENIQLVYEIIIVRKEEKKKVNDDINGCVFEQWTNE